MAFTEFCCRSGGSNMNGGALASGAEPAATPVYSATNGGWNSGTGVFTPTSGNPSLTVTVGDFAHVFADGSTTPTRIARVTAVSSTTITLSTSAGSGTAPTTAGSGISINVGGAWLGPNGSSSFPNTFITNALKNAAGSFPRVNFKNDQTYSITASITHTNSGPMCLQGYTATFGDLGKAVIDGGTSGASYVLLNQSGAGVDLVYADFELRNNGATGSQPATDLGSSRNIYFRCVAHDVRGSGFQNGVFISCEAYACNQSNTNLAGGFASANDGIFINCISHDNVGSNNRGFYKQGQAGFFFNCIADSNGSDGFAWQHLGSVVMLECDAYNNGGNGLNKLSTTGPVIVRNSNFINNASAGIRANGSGAEASGYVLNCGFYNNTSGATAGMSAIEVINPITYTGVPYVDAPNGDFRLADAAAKDTGYGLFQQIAAGYAGTIGYPDIGAALHQDAGGSSGPVGQLKIFRGGVPY